MILWRKIPAWLLRAWPLLALPPAFLLHWLLLKSFPKDPLVVNKIVGMLLQVIGGLLILYSINDNLGLFRRKSIPRAVADWFESFPISRKPVCANVSGIGSVIYSGTASVQASLVPSTIEERLATLEADIRTIRSEISTNEEAAHRQLHEAKEEIAGGLESTVNRIDDLSKKLEMATVGGFKTQAFGVLLALYGAVTSLYA